MPRNCVLHNFLTGFVVGVGALLTAMAAAADPVPAELAGMTWRWVHFASSAEDFAVAEPERYTLAFTAVGWIRLRADCNHGAGGAVFPKPSMIRIEEMALTLAMCPSGSLGDRFARDVARAVRWSIRERELHLELPADTGTLRLTRQR